MSATLDIDKFFSFFSAGSADSKVTVIQMEGRQYPVRIFYTKEPQKDYLESAALTIFQIHMETPCRSWTSHQISNGEKSLLTEFDEHADILVFLSGREDIEKLGQILRKDEQTLHDSLERIQNIQVPQNRLTSSQYGKLYLMPLYASLPAEQQMAIFEKTHLERPIVEKKSQEYPKGFRRVILATNVAETSVTVPHIRYVIDSGVMKERHFHADLSLDSLLVTPISQASARQRAGRAGRHTSGYCYRLFKEEDFSKLLKCSVPEMARTELTYLVLYLKSLNIDNILEFPYLDSPHPERLRLALQQLLGLGALDPENGKITSLGRTMALFPLEPKLSRMIVLAEKYGATDELITILSFLSVENLFHHKKREYPNSEGIMEVEDTAESIGLPWVDPSGDHMSLLRLYDTAKQQGIDLFLGKFGATVIHRQAFKEALQVRSQLISYCTRHQLPINSCGRNVDTVLACLMEGYRTSLANVAVLQGTSYIPLHQYKKNMNAKERTDADKKHSDDNTNSLKLKIHPSSSLFGQASLKGQTLPEMLMYHELVFTSQCYMKCISKVDPSLLLLKR